MTTTNENSEPGRPAGVAVDRVVRPLVPTRAEVDALMKRCQTGVGGRHALDNAHGIMADCYGTLGAMGAELERLRGLLERSATDVVRADNERAQIVAAERERCERLRAELRRVQDYIDETPELFEALGPLDHMA